MTSEPPVGEPLEGGPASLPGRRPLEGRYVRLEPVDPDLHADPLWRAAHDGSEEASRMWAYMPYGPFADEAEMRRWIASLVASEDPLFLAVVVSDGPAGMASSTAVSSGNATR